MSPFESLSKIWYVSVSTFRPTSGRVVKLETERLEVSGPNTGRACLPSRSEFSVVFSETRVNMGYDPL